MYRILWSFLSEAAHPSPQWNRVTFSQQHEGLIVGRDPASADDTRVRSLAVRAEGLLRMARTLIATYYKDESTV